MNGRPDSRRAHALFSGDRGRLSFEDIDGNRSSLIRGHHAENTPHFGNDAVACHAECVQFIQKVEPHHDRDLAFFCSMMFRLAIFASEMAPPISSDKCDAASFAASKVLKFR